MIDLTWEVPTRGFEWEVDRSPLTGVMAWNLPGPWLVTREKTNHPEGKTYQVKDEPALFKKFAELGNSRDNLLGFANTYGRLNHIDAKIPRILDGFIDGEQVALPAENIEWWRRDVKDVAHAVAWWEHTRGLNERWLEQFRESDGVATKLVLTLPGSGAIVEVPVRPQSKDKRTAGDDNNQPLSAAGWQALIKLLNGILQECPLRIRLEPDPRRRQGNSSRQPSLVQTREPADLLSAIWLQLAAAVGEGKQFHRCDLCSAWFEPASQRRGDARYCSDACRARAFRSKKVEVLEMGRAGLQPEEIAKLLDRDTKQVEQWLKRMKTKWRRRTGAKPTSPVKPGIRESEE